MNQLADCRLDDRVDVGININNKAQLPHVKLFQGGELRIEEIPSEDGVREIYSFVLNSDLEELPDKQTLAIKVSPRRSQ